MKVVDFLVLKQKSVNGRHNARQKLTTEVWVSDLAENPAPDNSFIGQSQDLSAYVNSNKINLAEAGVEPSVHEDYFRTDNGELPVQAINDIPHEAILKIYSTSQTRHNSLIEAELAYDKRSSIIKRHRAALAKEMAKRTAYAWGAVTNDKHNKILNLSASDSVIDALIDMQAFFQDLDVDMDGMNNELGDELGPPVQYGDPITPQTVKAGYGFIDNGIIEKNLYFYHPDHLGSSSYITDREGRITQHTEYIEFGEVLFEEHSTSRTMPYLFNGKELDSETNLTYFGARYLDMKTSLWLNTDPLAEKNDKEQIKLKFIVDNEEYDDHSTIYAMIDSGELSISMKTNKENTFMDEEIIWLFNNKEIARGKNLKQIKLTTTGLKEKVYKLTLKKENKEIAYLKIDLYNTPLLKFESSNRYNQSFLFDNEFEKNKINGIDYDKLSTFNDYRIPVLAVERDKLVELKINIQGLPNISKIKDFEIIIEEESLKKKVLIDNNINGVLKIKAPNISNNFTIIRLRMTDYTNFREPTYLIAKYKNKIIGKLKVYCYKPMNKKLQIVFVKWGDDNYRKIDIKEMENYLKNKSLNQLFINIDVNINNLDLNNVADKTFTQNIDKLISNYTSSNIEGKQLLDLLLEKYDKNYEKLQNTDIFFILNKNIFLSDDNELGGYHYIGKTGGVLFNHDSSPHENIAHELGYWLGLEHTWKEGTPETIPKGQTQNNFMDYFIKRKSWFEFQLNKIYQQYEKK